MYSENVQFKRIRTVGNQHIEDPENDEKILWKNHSLLVHKIQQ